MPKPTPSQARVIAQFNGDVAAHNGHRRPTDTTYKVCEKKGWIEQIEAWPYHRTTQAGADAIGVELTTAEAPAQTYSAATGHETERAICRHDGRPIYRNQHVTGFWIHEDGTGGRWCEGLASTAEPKIEFPQAVCVDSEPHATHLIVGTWRERCPGVEFSA